MSAPLMSRTGIHLLGRLTFLDSLDRYSVYRAPNGEEVCLAHGTAKRLVDFDTLDLDTLWSEWQEFSQPNSWSQYGRYNLDGFRDRIRELLTDPDKADEVSLCAECLTPNHEDSLTWTGSEERVCDSCVQYYSTCEECEEIYRYTQTTLNDDEVCDSCRDYNYSYCEECDGFFNHDDTDAHRHDEEGGCCEAPAQSFTIRNDGDPPLASDTRVTVSLPAGVISPEGLNRIKTYLQSHAYTLDDMVERDKVYSLAWQSEELDGRWQTKEGNYTKRLSRFAYKTFGIKLPPEVVSQVGCIARDESTPVNHQVEVTRDLNRPREEFVHEGSCWWTEYYESRCALKTNGGFGLRTFGEYDYPQGRAWVLPLRLTEIGGLTPTFETLEPDAFVVFNGYGDLEGYVPARIMSHMSGMTYRKIGFSCPPMYINNDSGYLVAPEEIANRYADGSLHLSVQQHSNLYDTERKAGISDVA